MDNQGLLLCARYSVAPNFFGYCGPDKNSNLLDHLKEGIGDKEVRNILSDFETLFLNLKLIAYENKIDDPFDWKVVEAYWIGNPFLKNIKNIDYVDLLKEKFKLEKKIGEKNFGILRHKFLSNILLPHHSFHVFNIFKRTGNLTIDHSLQTMDECRIGWGKIIEFPISNFPYRVNQYPINYQIKVETKLLNHENKRIFLGKRLIKQINVNYKGKQFIKNLKVGDWISFHWGFVCDVLTPLQVKNLEFYTKKAIDFYNQ